jgi:hypothetical protein
MKRIVLLLLPLLAAAIAVAFLALKRTPTTCQEDKGASPKAEPGQAVATSVVRLNPYTGHRGRVPV